MYIGIIGISFYTCIYASPDIDNASDAFGIPLTPCRSPTHPCDEFHLLSVRQQLMSLSRGQPADQWCAILQQWAKSLRKSPVNRTSDFREQNDLVDHPCSCCCAADTQDRPKNSSLIPHFKHRWSVSSSMSFDVKKKNKKINSLSTCRLKPSCLRYQTEIHSCSELTIVQFMTSCRLS